MLPVYIIKTFVGYHFQRIKLFNSTKLPLTLLQYTPSPASFMQHNKYEAFMKSSVVLSYKADNIMAFSEMNVKRE